jgi:hypothetical protein
MDGMTPSDHFTRLADQLGEVVDGSSAADLTLHLALERQGHVLAYTSNTACAWSLLPPGFEWLARTFAGDRVYAACRQRGTDDERTYPHHGQWGATEALAMCRAVIMAYAALEKG